MNRAILLFCLIFASAALGQDTKDHNFRGGLVTPPLSKPKFVLADTSGRSFDFSDQTKGYVTLLFFGYTFCPDQCPMHMANIGAALKKLPAGIADQVKLVFVTTDPARDTPQVLRRWLDLFDSRFIGLTGSEADIKAVQQAAGVPVASKTGPANGNYAVAHANFVIAYSKDNLAHVIYPGGVSKDDWVHDLPLLTNELWRLRPSN
jgi:protein SCO1/2